jgi:hypothetical protein
MLYATVFMTKYIMKTSMFSRELLSDELSIIRPKKELPFLLLQSAAVEEHSRPLAAWCYTSSDSA